MLHVQYDNVLVKKKKRIKKKSKYIYILLDYLVYVKAYCQK